MTSDLDTSAIVLDLETAPLPNVRDYVDLPDLADIQAPSNYVKPEAIAGYIEREKAKRLADFNQDCDSTAALDVNTARIVAVGCWTEQNGLTSRVSQTEPREAEIISDLWLQARQRTIVGFRIREFDLPMLIQRSRYLGIAYPSLDLGRYARGNSIIDLYDLLTFNDLRGENIMRRSLGSFARRFGIAHDDSIKGSQIAALVQAGEWDKVTSHVQADVLTTLALARRLGVVKAEQPESVVA